MVLNLDHSRSTLGASAVAYLGSVKFHATTLQPFEQQHSKTVIYSLGTENEKVKRRR